MYVILPYVTDQVGQVRMVYVLLESDVLIVICCVIFVFFFLILFFYLCFLFSTSFVLFQESAVTL